MSFFFGRKSYFYLLLILSGAAQAATLDGVVVDADTQAPIENAEVRYLEDGPSVKTGADGKFSLTVDKPSPNAAVSIDVAGYRPREANVQAGKPNTLAVSKTGTYHYFVPVQLDDGIKTADLKQAKLDPAPIQKLMEKAVGDGYKEPHSILVYHKGRLVVEEYFHGNNDFIIFEGGIQRDSSPAPIQWRRTSKHYVASVNKALTATVVGIALDRYKKSVNDKLSTFLPKRAEFFKDPNKAKLTIYDMLTMQTGFYWDEWVRGDLSLLWRSNDFTEFLLSRDNAGPKSEWKYVSASPNVLWEAVDTLTEGHAREWADQNFYAKLGITDYELKSQPGGLPEGGARMHMRSRDMLKVGVTYLNGGLWNGKRVVPAQWVKDVSKVQVKGPAGDYSYMFWHRDVEGVHYISADGDGGQYINIFPDRDLVVVITQGNYLEWPLYVKQAADMMGKYILPAVKKTK
jgi:CubicO group peptidase (beta-lactamase class C family)